MKQYENLSIRDHFMFGKICQDINNSQLILSALLNRNVILTNSGVEHYMQEYSTSKFIRLDLLAIDECGSVFNAEMQNKSTDLKRQHELPFRSRYYQALVDSSVVKEGMDYMDMPETYIIFICTYDPFGLNLPQYIIESSCREAPLLDYNDKSHKIFFNTTANLNSLPPSTKNMLEYIEKGKVTDRTTQHLNNVINNAIAKEIWKGDYMLTVVHDKDLYKDGFDSGYQSRQDEVNQLQKEVEEKDAIISQLKAQIKELQ